MAYPNLAKYQLLRIISIIIIIIMFWFFAVRLNKTVHNCSTSAMFDLFKDVFTPAFFCCSYQWQIPPHPKGWSSWMWCDPSVFLLVIRCCCSSWCTLIFHLSWSGPDSCGGVARPARDRATHLPCELPGCLVNLRGWIAPGKYGLLNSVGACWTGGDLFIKWDLWIIKTLNN